MSKLDKEQMKMVEVQADMMDLVLDCYVAQLGREGTVGMLDHAKITVNMGKHDILGADLPKNLIN